MKQLILFLFFFISILSRIQAQESCETFEDYQGYGTTGNWQVTNANLSTDYLLPVLPGYSGKFLSAEEEIDETNPSYLYNAVDFTTNPSMTVPDKTISFDFRFSSSLGFGNANISDIMYLYKGDDVLNPDVLAYFLLNPAAATSDLSGWMNVSMPITTASNNGELPSNSQGQWVMANGGTSADWDMLITDFTGVYFDIDMGFNNTEQIDIDNFCICEFPIAKFYIDGGTEIDGVFENFYCSEDIILKAPNSQNYNYRKYSLWRRPISMNGNNPWLWSGVLVSGNTTSIDNVNVETQIDTKPPEFPRLEVGFEYRVRLELSNECGSSIVFRKFRIIEIPAIDEGFTFETNYDENNPDVYSVTVTANSNVVPIHHLWKLFNGLPNGTVGNLIETEGILESATFYGLSFDETYYLQHGVWGMDDCFSWIASPHYGIVPPAIGPPQDRLSDNSNFASNNINIFPNPSKHNSEIQVEISENIKQIEIFDMSGKQIQIQSNNIGNNKSSFTINETVSSGIYVVRVLTEDNNVLMEKLVIE